MRATPDPLADGASFSLGFSADLAKVRQALASLLAAPQVCVLGADDRGTVELVLAEVLNNIVEHAYAGGTGPVEVDIRAQKSALWFRVADAGSPMPDGVLPKGLLPELPPLGDGLPDFADLPEGGFGWHLIRAMTRHLTYARRGGQNILTFEIPLAGQGSHDIGDRG